MPPPSPIFLPSIQFWGKFGRIKNWRPRLPGISCIRHCVDRLTTKAQLTLEFSSYYCKKASQKSSDQGSSTSVPQNSKQSPRCPNLPRTQRLFYYILSPNFTNLDRARDYTVCILASLPRNIVPFVAAGERCTPFSGPSYQYRS